jgi:hypothetical protein
LIPPERYSIFISAGFNVSEVRALTRAKTEPAVSAIAESNPSKKAASMSSDEGAGEDGNAD